MHSTCFHNGFKQMEQVILAIWVGQVVWMLVLAMSFGIREIWYGVYQNSMPQLVPALVVPGLVSATTILLR